MSCRCLISNPVGRRVNILWTFLYVVCPLMHIPNTWAANFSQINATIVCRWNRGTLEFPLNILILTLYELHTQKCFWVLWSKIHWSCVRLLLLRILRGMLLMKAEFYMSGYWHHFWTCSVDSVGSSEITEYFAWHVCCLPQTNTPAMAVSKDETYVIWRWWHLVQNR